MKKLILKLSTKFNFIDKWIISFIDLYCSTKRKKEIEYAHTEVLSEACQRDLEKIMTFERLGKMSGLNEPRMIKQPRI
jgi:hypothetical protein